MLFSLPLLLLLRLMRSGPRFTAITFGKPPRKNTRRCKQNGRQDLTRQILWNWNSYDRSPLNSPAGNSFHRPRSNQSQPPSATVFPIKHVRCLNMFDGTPESPKDHCHKTRGTLLSPQECKKSSVYPKSTQDEANFPFIGYIPIPCSTSYRTSSLTSFRKLHRIPETPVSNLYEY